MPGPAKKPTSRKKLEGTYRKDRAPEHEPVLPVEAPAKPEHLTDYAADHWDWLVPILVELRTITRIGSDALELYCEMYAQYRTGMEKIKKWGYVQVDDNGRESKRPEVLLVREALQGMNQLGQQFGWTPSARAKIEAAPPETATKKFTKPRVI